MLRNFDLLEIEEKFSWQSPSTSSNLLNDKVQEFSGHLEAAILLRRTLCLKKFLVMTDYDKINSTFCKINAKFVKNVMENICLGDIVSLFCVPL
jgi:hypothetical protein